MEQVQSQLKDDFSQMDENIIELETKIQILTQNNSNFSFFLIKYFRGINSKN